MGELDVGMAHVALWGGGGVVGREGDVKGGDEVLEQKVVAVRCHFVLWAFDGCHHFGLHIGVAGVGVGLDYVCTLCVQVGGYHGPQSVKGGDIVARVGCEGGCDVSGGWGVSVGEVNVVAGEVGPVGSQMLRALMLR